MTIPYAMEETAGYLVYRVGRLLRHKASGFLAKFEPALSPEQWGLLVRVAVQGDPALGELADPVLADHANVTRLVNGLERLGLVRRAPNPRDKRSSLVSATEAGMAHVDRVLPELLEAKGEYFAGLDEREVGTMIRCLRLVEANLEADAEADGES